MANITQEERLDAITRGRQAQMVGADLGQRIAEREQRIISRLVGEYRGGNLTHDTMLGAIGEISALRALEDDVDREAREGIEAADREFNTSPGP